MRFVFDITCDSADEVRAAMAAAFDTAAEGPFDGEATDAPRAFSVHVTPAAAALGAGQQADATGRALPAKHRELIALAVALTTACPYSLVQAHSDAAARAGATEGERVEAALVAAAINAKLTHLLTLAPELVASALHGSEAADGGSEGIVH